MKRVIIAVACLALSACGDNPGDDAAQAACRAYGTSPTTTAENAELRAEASERAQRAAEADDAYAALPRDMADA